MTRVTIFHNVTRNEEGRLVNFDRYATGAPLVRVFAYDSFRADSAEKLAENAFYLFNVDPCFMQPDDYEIARSYRDRGLRSVSVGDVIMVGGAAFTVERTGFGALDTGQLNEVHEEHYGTIPLRPDEQTP
jgi:hypothetical protein